MVTDEEIIDMATRANILEPIDLLPTNQWRQDTIRELHTFARLIAAKQREIDAERIEAIDGEWITKTAASSLIRSQKP
jgi:hypothetical protein